MGGRLQGRVAIVTGGGRGFGRAIAERLAREGAAVTVTARTRVQLDETVAAIQAQGGRALAVAGDSTDLEDVRRVIAGAAERFGPCDLLVNNAGVPGPFGPFAAVDPEAWWAAQAVHIRGPMLFIHAVLPGMIAAGGGHVINVSAKAAHLTVPFMSAYCTGKAAQNRMTELLACEGQPDRVFAFAIEPGFAITQLARDTMADPGARKWVPGMVGRLAAKAEDDPGLDDLDRCAERCVQLAGGAYDALSGRYFEPHDSLDEALAAQGDRP